MNETDQPLHILLDTELSSIEFVRDYLQFRFDGPCLTAVSDPCIMVEDGLFHRTDAGFCDQLLRFIGLPVDSAAVIAGQGLRIGFKGGRSLHISLRPDSYAAAEAAIFMDGRGGYWVW
jgi:hypothetical protein